jgi:hypothetical protein
MATFPLIPVVSVILVKLKEAGLRTHTPGGPGTVHIIIADDIAVITIYTLSKFNFVSEM